jgi:hypothetical protein
MPIHRNDPKPHPAACTRPVKEECLLLSKDGGPTSSNTRRKVNGSSVPVGIPSSLVIWLKLDGIARPNLNQEQEQGREPKDDVAMSVLNILKFYLKEMNLPHSFTFYRNELHYGYIIYTVFYSYYGGWMTLCDQDLR